MSTVQNSWTNIQTNNSTKLKRKNVSISNRFIGSSCPNVVFPFYSMTASPLRAEIGTRLQVLRLSSMKNVDTAAIIASCLNLKSLTLKFNDSFVYNEIPHSLI